MGKFSEKSLARLAETDPRLQALFRRVVSQYDCIVTAGYRSGADQDAAFRAGRSQKQAGQSKHNSYPALAIDVAPWPLQWENAKRFYHFAGYVKGVAEFMAIPIRWGGDWDSDLDLDDNGLVDLVHFEIKE